MSESKRAYLGDGVYVEVDRGMLRVFTSDGQNETNVIYLEPEVYEALVRYVASLKEAGA